MQEQKCDRQNTLLSDMQVSIYYCHIQSPDSVLHALQTQQTRPDCMYASWPLTSGVLGLFQSTSFPLSKHCKDQDVAVLSLI